jgi:hypothetical protein
MANPLVQHARRELEAIGEEPDIIDWYCKVVEVFTEAGHSGGSAGVAIPTLNRLLMFKNLGPLTNDPDEWHYHGPDMWDGEKGIWQNRRDGEAFSTDGGFSYTLLSEGKDGPLHISAKHNEPKPEEPTLFDL